MPSTTDLDRVNMALLHRRGPTANEQLDGVDSAVRAGDFKLAFLRLIEYLRNETREE